MSHTLLVPLLALLRAAKSDIASLLRTTLAGFIEAKNSGLPVRGLDCVLGQVMRRVGGKKLGLALPDVLSNLGEELGRWLFPFEP